MQGKRKCCPAYRHLVYVAGFAQGLVRIALADWSTHPDYRALVRREAGLAVS